MIFSTIRKPTSTIHWETLPAETVDNNAKSTYWKDGILWSSSINQVTSTYNSTSYDIQNTQATYSVSLNWDTGNEFEYDTKAGYIYNIVPGVITGDRNRLFHCTLLQDYTTTQVSSSSKYKWMSEYGRFVGVERTEAVSHTIGDADVYLYAAGWNPAVVSYNRYRYYPSGKTYPNFFNSSTWLTYANTHSMYSIPRGSFIVNCNNPFYYTITNHDETTVSILPGFPTIASVLETTSGFASNKTIVTKLGNINKPFVISMMAVGVQDVITGYSSSYTYYSVEMNPVISSSSVYYISDGYMTYSISTDYIRRK